MGHEVENQVILKLYDVFDIQTTATYHFVGELHPSQLGYRALVYSIFLLMDLTLNPESFITSYRWAEVR